MPAGYQTGALTSLFVKQARACWLLDDSWGGECLGTLNGYLALTGCGRFCLSEVLRDRQSSCDKVPKSKCETTITKPCDTVEEFGGGQSVLPCSSCMQDRLVPGPDHVVSLAILREGGYKGRSEGRHASNRGCRHARRTLHPSVSPADSDSVQAFATGTLTLEHVERSPVLASSPIGSTVCSQPARLSAWEAPSMASAQRVRSALTCNAQ